MSNMLTINGLKPEFLLTVLYSVIFQPTKDDQEQENIQSSGVIS